MYEVPLILVAEDDPVFRRVIAMTVTKFGFRAETVADGVEAFERLLLGGIDFLVTDHQMPRCNGHELLIRIAATPTIPFPPTILCTAKGFEMDRDALRDAFSLVAILHKPFSPSRLGELLKDRLASKPVLREA